MIGMKAEELDTPSLLIDLDRMERNLKEMQALVDSAGVKLRPHTKTHKMADIARLQLEYGAQGITVAKLGEAEAMAEAGITDIFIATEIVGELKMARLRSLAEKAKVRLAVDSIFHVEQMVRCFGKQIPVEVMIELDTGMHRCGVEPGEAVALAGEIVHRFPQVKLAGIFTHEGHTYNAADKEEMKQIALDTQRQAIETGKQIEAKWGILCEISIGCTLGQLTGEFLPGITEARPGTYVFYDAGHAYYLGDINRCAATILSTVTSKKGEEQVVADAGAKSMSIDQRSSGVLKTEGFGAIKALPDLLIRKLSDEHAVIRPGGSLNLGDRIEIYPNHVCPTVNLYNKAYGIRDGRVEKIFTITARGCIQ
ncbi:D-serine deaminase-like pyridoxal phosphate-dependent protein [Paenibacillus forsythiae]|uniref:D-serine deaminase-like pyridoxal phosphate-dependent protein n=1 Tax=Paenibacillus forsythiae TaxID=365616 RepID=A0ABU3H2D9_9BACL|nr:alanine racemase [Paenibacillus forsythiae]MDT3424977.1 D-serine deaminase-like pyridoxal phosphate-dependent protein [Paenibacillus forsythiae]